MSRGLGRVFRPKVGGRETAVWWLDFSVRGERHRESSGTTRRSDAQRLLRQRLTEREVGKVVGRPDRVTFKDVRKGLERHYEREGNRSLRRAQQALDHLEEFLGAERRAMEISRHLVNTYTEHRLAEGAARSTATYEVRILGAALSGAVE